MSFSDESSFKVGCKVMAAVAEKVTDVGLQSILLGTSLSPIASITAAVLATGVKSVIEELDAQTSAIVEKLDLVLKEPLASAVEAVVDVLTVHCETAAEARECERQLSYAFDSLRRARAYTSAKGLPHRRLVRMYQALVAALKEGGRPFALLYVRDLRSLSSQVRKESLTARKQAAELEPESYEEHREAVVRYSIDYFDYYDNIAAIDKCIGDEERLKQLLTERAVALETWSERMDSFCLFVEHVCKHRDEIMSAGRN